MKKKLLATAAIALAGTFGAPLVANAHVNEPGHVIAAKLELTGPSGSADLYLSPASSQAREDLSIEPVIAATVSPKVRAEWRKMRNWGGEKWSPSQAMKIDRAEDRQPFRDYDSSSRPAV